MMIFIIDACSKQTLKASLQRLRNRKMTAVRGVHLPHHTLETTEKTTKTLNFCQELGINAVFIPVWDKGEVAFPSQVMKNVANIPFNTKRYDHADPLHFFIQEADKRKLKVFIVFDFELDALHQKNTNLIFQNHPDRIAINAQNKPALRFGSKQLNTLNFDVQDFMTNLILETVKFYKPHGIRINTGLTAQAGYDITTIKRYQAENHGKKPPVYPQDFQWVEWRTKILTDYTESLYRQIKKMSPKIMIGVMPNEYPKCKADNLRDWIHQVRGGFADLISPRLYRENLNLYRENLDNLIKFQVDKSHIKLIFPDILPENGIADLPEATIKEMIAEHRERKIYGEIVPLEWLQKYKEFFQTLYRKPVIFPHEVARKKWNLENLVTKKVKIPTQAAAGVADTELNEEEFTETIEEEIPEKEELTPDDETPINSTEDETIEESIEDENLDESDSEI